MRGRIRIGGRALARARPGAALVAAALGAAMALATPGSVRAATGGIAYRVGGDCDGYPAVALQAPAPLCVGLVATQLGFARGVAVIGHDVFVSDMGGWGSHRGRLLQLPDDGRGARRVVLQGLDQPNALVRGPGRTLLLAVDGRVLQVDPFAADPSKSARVVVDALPSTGLHPLSGLAFAPDGSLYVSVGSASDNCHREAGALPDPAVPCPETLEHPPRGSVLRFPSVVRPATTAATGAGSLPWHAPEQAAFSTGLRNPMAMTVLPDGRLVAGVNARDAISTVAPALSDAELPHDLLVVPRPGADYGWPYCYDRLVPSPEYPKADCASRRPPDLLLPAHAAPLGLLVVHGARLPGLQGRLLVAFHGYREHGHRLVSFGLDGAGLPAGASSDVVSGWGPEPGRHPQGAPVGMAEMDDGSVLVVEDHNGTLLRLSVRAGYLRASDTPHTASAIPASASPLKVSPNSAQATSAVQGGTR